jgi:hypothetical protein
MNWTKQHAVKLIGLVFITSVISFLIVIVFSLSIGLMTQYQIKVPNFNVLTKVQRIFYFAGYREIWQYKEDCVVVDKKLVYKPLEGSCKFGNLEFDTILTFNTNGRVHESLWNIESPRIAVLGDSYAMGWGVGDDQTFSAELQRLTGRRVYNLGVSSHATEQEIERLLQLPELDKVDTVIIQYCDNDLASNREFPINLSKAQNRFKSSREAYPLSRGSTLARGFKSTVKVAGRAVLPEEAKEVLRRLLGRTPSSPHRESVENMSPHRESVEDILRHYVDQLSDKRIIVFSVGSRQINAIDWVEEYAHGDLAIQFVDLSLDKTDFYQIDDHLNSQGHKSIAMQLSKMLK